MQSNSEKSSYFPFYFLNLYILLFLKQYEGTNKMFRLGKCKHFYLLSLYANKMGILFIEQHNETYSISSEEIVLPFTYRNVK